ncbi:hypothetical protein A9310_17480 [Gordonia sp. UCD-TK1]|nr:hypothetical protein A9310_17480 [Gordonia sp. UCD-TK1]
MVTFAARLTACKEDGAICARTMSVVTEADTRVQVLRKGIVREGDEFVDPVFVPNAIDNLFKHWITPQLGAFVPRSSIYQALVLLDREHPKVLINHDAPFWAVAGEPPIICDPRDAFIGQIITLLPQTLEPTERWLGFATAIEGRCVSMDLADSLDRVDALLGKARSDLEVVLFAIDRGLVASAIELLFAAAELSVMTLIYYAQWDDQKLHHRRERWLRDQIAAGQLPAEFGTTFRALYRERNPARYVEGQLQLTQPEVEQHARTVRQMIDYARVIRPATPPGESPDE